MIGGQTIQLRIVKSIEAARRLLATASDREVSEALGLNLASLKNFAADCLQKASLGTQLTFAVCDKEIVGGIWLQVMEDRQQARIVYWVAREFWGNGYATEGVRQVIRVAEDELKIKRLTALINPANSVSKNVALKCGFQIRSQSVHWNDAEQKEEKLDIFMREKAE